MKNKTFIILFILQSIVFIFINDKMSDAPWVILKFFVIYFVCWYLFTLPTLALLIVSRKVIGTVGFLYIIIAITIIVDYDASIKWTETGGLLSVCFLIPLTIFYLAYKRLDDARIDVWRAEGENPLPALKNP